MKPTEVLEKCLGLTEDPTEKKGRAKRLSALLRPPEADETPDWFMCVPSFFNNAIDLKQTTLAGNTQWTQGSAFSFKTGDTLYDTPEAYREWHQALRRIKLCVQVRSATNAVPERRSKKKGLIAPRNPGAVSIVIYVPKADPSVIEPIGRFQLTQDEFVRFLIAGPGDELQARIDAS